MVSRLKFRGKLRPRVRAAIAWSYCLLLIYLLLAPSPLSPFGEWGNGTQDAIDHTLSGSLQHLIAYFVLVSVFWWSTIPQNREMRGILLGSLCLHAAVFEGLQAFIPTRECDWLDFFCNLTGIALGVSVLWMLGLWDGNEVKDLPHSKETPHLLSKAVPPERGQ